MLQPTKLYLKKSSFLINLSLLSIYAFLLWKFSSTGYEYLTIIWMFSFCILSHYSDYARNITVPVVSIGGYLFTTIFFNKSIGVLDWVFLFIIMFIFQVL
jgi:hypothetical protein